MKIIDPTFEFIHIEPRAGVYRTIARAMKNCYRAELNTTPKTDAEMVEKAMKLNHLSLIEHVVVTVNITCDRGVTHELVRHRLASYSQESTRYCVAGNMRLSTRNQHHKITIAELFANKENSSNGSWKRVLIRCMDEKTGLLVYSKIKDIHCMGILPVRRLKTRLGYEIECTGDHEILTSEGWLEAAEIKLGDEIAINGTQILYQNKDWLFHQYNTLNKTAVQIADEFGFTASAIKKWVKKHGLPKKPKSYFNKGRTAWNKGLSASDNPGVAAQAEALDKYKWREGRYTGKKRHERIQVFSKSTYRDLVDIECALCGKKDDLHVHHIDENRDNNRPENLETLCSSCHQRIHAKNLEAVHYDQVVSIEDAGMTMVYDIEMSGPNKNFVANGVVVHNCNYSGDKFGRELTFIRPAGKSEQILGSHTIEWPNLIGVRKEGQINPELDPGTNVFFWHLAVAERDYMWLLDAGWTPQEARAVLPNSLATEIAMTANLREWIHVFRMRCDLPAHPDMRTTMKPILLAMLDHYPHIFQSVHNWLANKGALK